jgi:UV DNA damage repair endonuclease
VLNQLAAGVAVYRIGIYRPCSDIFPIHGWVQKYWTTLLEIQLTDVKFSNLPALRLGFLQRAA